MVQVQPRKHVLLIQIMQIIRVPPRQHELDHTDHTDHTDHIDHARSGIDLPKRSS